MAAPMVAGVAALVLSKYPKLNPARLRHKILDNVDKKSALSNLCVSGGRLNAFKVLNSFEDGWEQPLFDSNENDYGVITASGWSGSRQPYGAFDGWIGSVEGGNNAGYPAAQWTLNGTSGWIELKLKNTYLKITQIEFYNRSSGSGDNWTRLAFFTGTGGIPLGNRFTAKKESLGRSIIPVNNVITDTIRLNILSSYGSTYIGAGEIVITATEVDELGRWEQPIWTSATQTTDGISHGTITANNSATATSRLPYGAFDGSFTGSASGPNYPAWQWTAGGKTGWIEMKLNYPILVSELYFYNRVSGSGDNWTRFARFNTGVGGLYGGHNMGEQFTAVKASYGVTRVVLDIPRETDTVRLTITDSFGATYIGAVAIVVIATVA